MPRVTVDGVPVEVSKGATILDAVHAAGKKTFFEQQAVKGVNNKLCPLLNVVEVNGKLVPAALVEAADGLAVSTDTPKVREAFTKRLKLITEYGCPIANMISLLSIGDAVKRYALIAKLLGVAPTDEKAIARAIVEVGSKLEELLPSKLWMRTKYVLIGAEPSTTYDAGRCLGCGLCAKVCEEVQGCSALILDETTRTIQIIDERCVRCGQCTHACPLGQLTRTHYEVYKVTNCWSCLYSRPTPAFREKDVTDLLWKYLKDESKKVVVQIAPAVRVGIGEFFGYEPGTVIVGPLRAALRRLGFDKIWDTNWAADLTIMEEGTELVYRLIKAGVLKPDEVAFEVNEHILHEVSSTLPQFTSCSPGWVRFCETYFPDLIPHISSAKSPQQMFGATAKTYAAKELGWNPEDIVSVSIMPCTAKKYEAARPEFKDAYEWWKEHEPDAHYKEFRDVDIVITVKELQKIMKEAGIDLRDMPDEPPDPLLGQYTGAAAIFGRTGGVMTAALRTAYKLITGKELPPSAIEFEELTTFKGIKVAKVYFEELGKEIKVAVAHGLQNAKKICESVRSGGEFARFHFIEFMACPGGCIGGGGMPDAGVDVLLARIEGLNKHDRELPLRKSHENPEIIRAYQRFFKYPCSEISHHLLHTHYTPKPVPEKPTILRAV